MKRIPFCLVFLLAFPTFSNAGTVSSACEKLLFWSARGYDFWQYTIPLNSGLVSRAGHNILTLRRDVSWSVAYGPAAFRGQLVFDDVRNAYPDNRVTFLNFDSNLYTIAGDLRSFPAGTILVLDNSLVKVAIIRPVESEIDKHFIRFVRMLHHSLMGSDNYYEDDARSVPINRELLSFVSERYVRLAGRPLPVDQVILSAVSGERDPVVLKLLRKRAQIEMKFGR